MPNRIKSELIGGERTISALRISRPTWGREHLRRQFSRTHRSKPTTKLRSKDKSIGLPTVSRANLKSNSARFTATENANRAASRTRMRPKKSCEKVWMAGRVRRKSVAQKREIVFQRAQKTCPTITRGAEFRPRLETICRLRAAKSETIWAANFVLGEWLDEFCQSLLKLGGQKKPFRC